MQKVRRGNVCKPGTCRCTRCKLRVAKREIHVVNLGVSLCDDCYRTCGWAETKG